MRSTHRHGPMESLLLLRRIPHLSALGPQALGQLVAASTVVRMRRGHTLTADDELAEQALVTVSAGLERNGEEVTEVGWDAFFRRQRPEPVDIVMSGRVMCVPLAALSDLLRDGSEGGRRLLAHFAKQHAPWEVLFAAVPEEAQQDFGVVHRVQHLRRHPLLKHANIASLMELASASEVTKLARGDVLEPDDQARCVFSVVKGHLLSDERPLGPGSEVGLLQAFSESEEGGRRLIAAQDVTGLSYDPLLLLQLAETDLGLMRGLIGWFAEDRDPTLSVPVSLMTSLNS